MKIKALQEARVDVEFAHQWIIEPYGTAERSGPARREPSTDIVVKAVQAPLPISEPPFHVLPVYLILKLDQLLGNIHCNTSETAAGKAAAVRPSYFRSTPSNCWRLNGLILKPTTSLRTGS